MPIHTPEAGRLDACTTRGTEEGVGTWRTQDRRGPTRHSGTRGPTLHTRGTPTCRASRRHRGYRDAATWNCGPSGDRREAQDRRGRPQNPAQLGRGGTASTTAYPPPPVSAAKPGPFEG